MPPQHERAPADRRQSLIDAARRLFAQRPYDQVTTSEIAKEAGVAYGLIAHHFENKRGLYLAVMDDIARRVATAQLSTPPPGASPADQLRHALRGHITHVDANPENFVAFIRGTLGSDPQQQRAIDDLRWQGIQRALILVGIDEPVPPVLRAALRGWASYIDEMLVDRIAHRDLDADAVIEMAVATLQATLRATAQLHPATPISSAITAALNSFHISISDDGHVADRAVDAKAPKSRRILHH